LNAELRKGGCSISVANTPISPHAGAMLGNKCHCHSLRRALTWLEVGALLVISCATSGCRNHSPKKATAWPIPWEMEQQRTDVELIVSVPKSIRQGQSIPLTIVLTNKGLDSVGYACLSEYSDCRIEVFDPTGNPCRPTEFGWNNLARSLVRDKFFGRYKEGLIYLEGGSCMTGWLSSPLKERQPVPMFDFYTGLYDASRSSPASAEWDLDLEKCFVFQPGEHLLLVSFRRWPRVLAKPVRFTIDPSRRHGRAP
jgi:hypothetical protein